ncbi:hypothetical protein NL676_002618 [Syzygium grande]|nr:hypothetical protein NL676_002618 [Syzygium grande]
MGNPVGEPQFRRNSKVEGANGIGGEGGFRRRGNLGSSSCYFRFGCGEDETLAGWPSPQWPLQQGSPSLLYQDLADPRPHALSISLVVGCNCGGVGSGRDCLPNSDITY